MASWTFGRNIGQDNHLFINNVAYYINNINVYINIIKYEYKYVNILMKIINNVYNLEIDISTE